MKPSRARALLVSGLLLLMACDFGGGSTPPGTSIAGAGGAVQPGPSAGRGGGGAGGAAATATGGGGGSDPAGSPGGAGGAAGSGGQIGPGAGGAGAAAGASGGNGGTGSPDPLVDAGPSPPDTPAASEYPAGPYGFRVGNVVPNVTLTDRMGKPVTLGELRDRPGVRVILWSSGAEWCPACRGEVGTLKTLQMQKGPEGLLILESLHQSVDFKPADLATLERWDRMFQVNYLLTVEKSPPYDPRVNNPVVLAINARTMKILSRETHAEGDVVAAVNAALAASR